VSTEKVSATIDEGLLRQIRRRVGRRGVSSFLNAAAAEKLQRERILELLDTLDAEHGTPTAAERKAAERELGKVFGRGA
jgi:hypothetical protein